MVKDEGLQVVTKRPRGYRVIISMNVFFKESEMTCLREKLINIDDCHQHRVTRYDGYFLVLKPRDHDQIEEE